MSGGRDLADAADFHSVSHANAYAEHRKNSQESWYKTHQNPMQGSSLKEPSPPLLLGSLMCLFSEQNNCWKLNWNNFGFSEGAG